MLFNCKIMLVAVCAIASAVATPDFLNRQRQMCQGSTNSNAIVRCVTELMAVALVRCLTQ